MRHAWTVWRGHIAEWLGADRWGRGRPRKIRIAVLIIWAGFIVFPLFDAITGGGSEPDYALTIAGAAAFTLGYVWLCLIWVDLPETPAAYALTAVLGGLAVALTVGIDPDWAFLFTYVAASAALITPSPNGAPVVLVCAVVAGLAAALGGADGGTAIGNGASAAGVGFLLVLLRDLRVRNAQLDEARAELAQTAVAAERERFARDLHDLLGHSLSVIAIKAELAGRLLPVAPDRAAGEIAELEGVARTALSEVRDAVSGYRRPTLDDELEGARMALTAAGIIAEFQRSPVPLAPEVEAVLAWAVREGATNVIRHSGARRCAVRIHADGEAAEAVVFDDGAAEVAKVTKAGGVAGVAVGAAAAAGADADGGSIATAGSPRIGNGLAGLRERALAVQGRLEAGPVAGGGFRLSVAVPVDVRPAGGAAS